MRNNIIISKMLSYTDKVISYCDGLSYAEFSKNQILTEACVFNISQLGELTTKLDAEFTAEHPELPWHQMKGLRNKIVHDYEGVNLNLVWEIISNDLPKLKAQLLEIK